jgi:beta-xylosidase
MLPPAVVLLAALALPAAAEPIWGDQGDGTFRNPVLWMDYNNPCVIRHGDSFYLTAATHHFMGMPILKSRDLVNW